jgi:hypothetical protein
LIVILALIACALVGYQHRVHQFPVRVTTTTEPKASPSSVEIENGQ